jgi:hypothetical protein
MEISYVSINSKSFQRSSSDITDLLLFYSIISNYGILSFIMGYNTTDLNPLLNTIANQNNYKFTAADQTTYFS